MTRLRWTLLAGLLIVSRLSHAQTMLQDPDHRPSLDAIVAQAREAAQAAVSSGEFEVYGELAPETAEALKRAAESHGPLPVGVTLRVFTGPPWPADNPSIHILVDGALVYSEYLVHSERNLARRRRRLSRPGTWLIPSEPSADLAKRFAAALTLASEARLAAPPGGGR